MHGEELLSEIARYAADKKAIDVVELDLRGLLGLHRYFSSARATPGARRRRSTMASRGAQARARMLPRRVEGSAQPAGY